MRKILFNFFQVTLAEQNVYYLKKHKNLVLYQQQKVPWKLERNEQLW
jgi:hypothetical protein